VTTRQEASAQLQAAARKNEQLLMLAVGLTLVLDVAIVALVRWPDRLTVAVVALTGVLWSALALGATRALRRAYAREDEWMAVVDAMRAADDRQMQGRADGEVRITIWPGAEPPTVN
jgi:hypothetical protein